MDILDSSSLTLVNLLLGVVIAAVFAGLGWALIAEERARRREDKLSDELDSDMETIFHPPGDEKHHTG